jgi:hypothetical protein
MNPIVPKGTKIHIDLSTGYAGMDERSNYILSRDYTEDELNDLAWEMALDNAEMYGIYNANDLDDEPEEDEEDNYSYNIEGYWEIYDPEKHEGYFYSNKEEFQEL